MASSSPSKPSKEKKSKRKSSNKSKIQHDYFSSPDGDNLPPFFLNCISFLEECALEAEGILRITGRTQDTKAIRAFLCDGSSSTGHATLAQVDPHAVASLLKSFFTDSPFSLLPTEKYHLLIKIGVDASDNLSLLREIIEGLPVPHQRVLHRVMVFLENVRQNSAKNKMDARALSITFSPLLLRPPAEISPAQILSDSNGSVAVVMKILENFGQLFDGLGTGLERVPSSPLPSSSIKREASAIFKYEKDRVKIRFFLEFSVITGGNISGTVSLFLKWARHGVRRESGQTERLVCTNPQEVMWNDVVPMECTLLLNRRSRAFDPKNITVTLKEEREKGTMTTKTIGSVLVNLADLTPIQLPDSMAPKFETRQYNMISKMKGLLLIVRSRAEWHKINNKILLARTDDGNNLQTSFVSPSHSPGMVYSPSSGMSRKASMRTNMSLRAGEHPNQHGTSDSDSDFSGSDNEPDLRRLASSKYTTIPDHPQHRPRHHHTIVPVMQNGGGDSIFFVKPEEGKKIEEVKKKEVPHEEAVNTEVVSPPTTQLRQSVDESEQKKLLEKIAALEEELERQRQSLISYKERTVELEDELEAQREIEIDKEREREYARESERAVSLMKITELTEQVGFLQQTKTELRVENFQLMQHVVQNNVYFPRQPRQWIEKDSIFLTPSADQIMDKLEKMNCFSEPMNFAVNFYDEILLALEHELLRTVDIGARLYWFSTLLGLIHLLSGVVETIKDPLRFGVKSLIRTRFLELPTADNQDTNQDLPYLLFVTLSAAPSIDSRSNTPRGATPRSTPRSPISNTPRSGFVESPRSTISSPRSESLSSDFGSSSVSSTPRSAATSSVPSTPRSSDFVHSNRNGAQSPLSTPRSQTVLFAPLVLSNTASAKSFDSPRLASARYITNSKSFNAAVNTNTNPILPLEKTDRTQSEPETETQNLLDSSEEDVNDVAVPEGPINLAHNNLIGFVDGLCGLALGVYDNLLKALNKNMEEERLVFLFLGRPKGEKKWGPTVKEAAAFKYEIKDLLSSLDNHIAVMVHYRLYEIMVVSLIKQVLWYVDEIVFNQLLDVKSLSHTDGINIKMRITEVDHWWSEKCTQLKMENTETQSTVTSMRYVSEVANLLMVDKEKMESESFITSTFSFMKPVQILRILEILKVDKQAKKQVPNNMIKTLQTMVKSSTQNGDKNNVDETNPLFINYARKLHVHLN